MGEAGVKAALAELGQRRRPVDQLVGDQVDDLALALQPPGDAQQLGADHRLSIALKHARAR
jgi:hypothetical protein